MSSKKKVKSKKKKTAAPKPVKRDPQFATCRKCMVPGGTHQSGYRERADRPGKFFSECRECEAAAERVRYEKRQQRQSSDFSSLRSEDFAVGVANDGRVDENASEEKRQEYSEAMGELAADLAESGGDPTKIRPELGTYVARLAEQERRFGNRRLARSVSLLVAHEALARRQFIEACDQYLNRRVEPLGYALDSRPHVTKRDVILKLSDLHFGAELDPASNPIPYRAVEEARRFEYVIRQALDFKPQYRDQSRLRLLVNGDVIEGFLGHDLRAGAPLTEQKAVFWEYMTAAIGLLAQVYPTIEVECQPGNHGRNIARHPGRATEFKWDGIEWDMYYALRKMCSSLKNVSWKLPFRAVSVIDLFGAKMLMSHGDTEVPIADPDTQAAKNALMLERINSSREYGCEFRVAAFGHFHKSRNQGGHIIKIFNGCLVPPNGHARGKGYISEGCSQTIWEAVEGHPVGDYRRIEVGQMQDHDEQLGKLIKPFRFDMSSVLA